MTLRLPDEPRRVISLQLISADHMKDTVTFGFWSELYDGPYEDLGTITISTRTLYRLLLSCRGDE